MSDAKQVIVGGVPILLKDEEARSSIGNLSNLNTTAKNNLVAAINEAAQSGGGEGSDPEAVKFVSQSLTASQKTQARTNIGAASSGDIPSVPVISTDISADASSDLKTASPKAVKTYVDSHSGSGTDPEAVKYTSQTLTSSQKEQARNNIEAGTYSKALTGIPKTDMTSGVQDSLDLADSSLQYTPSGEVDPEVTPADYATREELVLLQQNMNDLQRMLIESGQLSVALFKKLVYKDGDAEDVVNALEASIVGELLSITVEFTQSGSVYEGQFLDELRSDLVVTANYSGDVSVQVSGYTLSGTLEEGTSTITVTYGGKTDTFDVVVTDAVYYRRNTNETTVVARQVALRSAYTSSTKFRAATINGATYWFTHKYPDVSGAVSRACYYLFDLLLTAGETYQFIIYYDGKPSGYDIAVGLPYYDETFHTAGVANAGSTQADYDSHITDSGWLTPQDDGEKLTLSYESPENTVGTRIAFNLLNGGTAQTWPSSLKITKVVIREVSNE